MQRGVNALWLGHIVCIVNSCWLVGLCRPQQENECDDNERYQNRSLEGEHCEERSSQGRERPDLPRTRLLLERKGWRVMTRVGERSWSLGGGSSLGGRERCFLQKVDPQVILKRRLRRKQGLSVLVQSLLHIGLCWAEKTGITNFDVVLPAWLWLRWLST